MHVTAGMGKDSEGERNGMGEARGRERGREEIVEKYVFKDKEGR